MMIHVLLCQVQDDLPVHVAQLPWRQRGGGNQVIVVVFL